ncbi:MAG TPA: glycosyltransferase [Candidatus Acidoferrales bacterium]|nr:glycosyltransferase [Candidatus Acidoferrales bacterium]
MTDLVLLLFWLSIAWLAYVYAGYPLILWIAGYWRRFVPEVREDYFPHVSVLISARNEEKDILWKVTETLAWNYPPERLELLIASDASEDGTDEILRSVKDPRLRYIRIENRVGKNEALNQLVQMATGELLLFSDANSHIGKDCLRSMVHHFADPRVGAVTGTEHTLSEGDELAVGSGTCAYLDYEFMVSRLESRVGSVIVCDGSLFVIRRSLFHQLQPDLANDLELPLYIGAKGYKLLCETTAWALEKAMRSPREEFNRKRRICGQGVLGFWRLRSCLHGFRAWQFLSRKVLRWLSLVPMTLILLSNIALQGRPFFKILLGLQIAFYVFALLGFLLSQAGRRGTALFTAPFYFLLVNLAAITGVAQACTGRRFAIWEVAVLSRGQENA